MTSPAVVTVDGRDPKALREAAHAILDAALPVEVLAHIAFQLQACAIERTHGGLTIELHTYAGKVRSANFNRRTHWQPGAKETTR